MSCWQEVWGCAGSEIDVHVGREQELVLLGVAERPCAVRPVVTDIGTDVQPFQRFPVHARSDGVVAGGGAGGTERAAGGEAVARAVQ